MRTTLARPPPGLLQEELEDVLDVLVFFGGHLHKIAREAFVIDPVERIELFHLKKTSRYRRRRRKGKRKRKGGRRRRNKKKVSGDEG